MKSQTCESCDRKIDWLHHSDINNIESTSATVKEATDVRQHFRVSHEPCEIDRSRGSLYGPVKYVTAPTPQLCKTINNDKDDLRLKGIVLTSHTFIQAHVETFLLCPQISTAARLVAS